MWPFSGVLPSRPPITYDLRGTSQFPQSLPGGIVTEGSDGYGYLAIAVSGRTVPANSLLKGWIASSAYNNFAIAQYDEQHTFIDPIEDWTDDLWVRYTMNSGPNPYIGNTGTWLLLRPDSTSPTLIWRSQALGGFPDIDVEIIVELATDNQGNDIVATGYYTAQLEVTDFS